MDNRLEALKKLIESGQFTDQKSLIEALRNEYNIETNQASISRDLHKLGVVKKRVNGELIYQIGEFDPKIEILRLGVVRVVKNEAMIIVHTINGLADFVGDYIDTHVGQEVIGCLAGENVVFVSPTTITQIDAVYQLICEVLYYGGEA
jgi:transcriptional regulator of arginine metabolism